MKIIKSIAAVVAATILFSGAGLSGAVLNAAPAYAASTQSEIDAAVAQIFKDTNAQRAAAGLKPLILSTSMSQVSQEWTQNMAANQWMSHNPDFQSQLPPHWMSVGENVAMGYTPATVVAAWMASPGHKANILGSNYTHIGLGYYVDETGRGWFTQNFGQYSIPTLSAVADPTNLVSSTEFTSRWPAKTGEMVSEYVAELHAADGALLETQRIDPPVSEVTFKGLTDKTTYTVNITSHGKDGTGLDYYSQPTTYNVTTFNDLPSVTAPTGLQAWPGIHTIQTVWTAPGSFHGNLQPYTVELKQGSLVVRSATTTDTQYLFSGLPGNAQYTASIKATSTIQDRVATAVATLDTATGQDLTEARVSVPTSFAVTAPSFSSIYAAWGLPQDQSGIALTYTLTLQAPGKPDVVVQTQGNDYLFGGLDPNTAYSVMIQAAVKAWESTNTATSGIVSGSVTTPEDPSKVAVAPPTLLSADVAPTQATLRWTAPENVTGRLTNYTITVKSAGKPDRTSTTTDTEPSYTVIGLQEHTSYTFEVKANAVSASGAVQASSTPASVTKTTPYAPSTVIVAAPQNVTATAAGFDHIIAAWTAPAGTVGSLIGYRVTLKDGTGVVDSRIVNALNTSFTGLKDNTSYTVEVAALASSPDSTKTAVSAVAKATVATPVGPGTVVAPNAPARLAATPVTYDRVTLNWTAPTGIIGGTVTGYTVTVSQTGHPDRVLKAAGASLAVTGLTGNTAYTISVAANVSSADGQKQITTPKASAVVTTPYSPSTVKVGAPALTVSGVGADRATVSWKKPAVTGSVTGYRATVKLGTRVLQTHSLSAATLAKVVVGLAENTGYVVVVEAFAVSPDGKHTAGSYNTKAVRTGFTAASTVRVHAPAVAVSSTRSAVTATWTSPYVYGKVVNYTVSIKQGTRVLATYTTAGGRMTFSGYLRPGTTYTVSVRANAVSANGKYTATATTTKTIATRR